jgi:hypothetical protein
MAGRHKKGSLYKLYREEYAIARAACRKRQTFHHSLLPFEQGNVFDPLYKPLEGLTFHHSLHSPHSMQVCLAHYSCSQESKIEEAFSLAAGKIVWFDNLFVLIGTFMVQ